RRRAHLRLSDRYPRGHIRRCDDSGLGAAAVRPAGDDLESDHQRDPGRESSRPRPELETSGHDRVGVAGSSSAWLLGTRTGARHEYETVTPPSRLTHGETAQAFRFFLAHLD